METVCFFVLAKKGPAKVKDLSGRFLYGSHA